MAGLVHRPRRFSTESSRLGGGALAPARRRPATPGLGHPGWRRSTEKQARKAPRPTKAGRRVDPRRGAELGARAASAEGQPGWGLCLWRNTGRRCRHSSAGGAHVRSRRRRHAASRWPGRVRRRPAQHRVPFVARGRGAGPGRRLHRPPTGTPDQRHRRTRAAARDQVPGVQQGEAARAPSRLAAFVGRRAEEILSQLVGLAARAGQSGARCLPRRPAPRARFHGDAAGEAGCYLSLPITPARGAAPPAAGLAGPGEAEAAARGRSPDCWAHPPAGRERLGGVVDRCREGLGGVYAGGRVRPVPLKTGRRYRPAV